MLSASPAVALGRAEIAARIPHTDDMCLLDGVESWDDENIVCTTRTHLDGNNPLREAGRLGAACGVEYAAQAMAIHGALRAGLADDSRPRAGFLASMRDVQLHVARLDDIAEALRIEANRLSGDGQTVLYGFSLRSSENVLLTGRAAVVLDADKLQEKSA